MIDTSGDPMHREWKASKERTKEHYASYETMLRRYHGAYYRGDGEFPGNLENRAYEALSLLSIQMIGGHPSWIVRPMTTDRGRSQSIAMRFALQRLARDTNLKKCLRKLFVDFEFRQCIAFVRRTPAQGNDLGPASGPRYRPELRRLSWRQFGYDPLSTDHDEDRWRGHESIWDIETLIEHAKANPEEGWDLEALELMHPEDSAEDIWALRKQAGDTTKRDVPQRNEGLIVEIWFPEEANDEPYTPENGFHGKWHTYACVPRMRALQAERKPNGRRAGLLDRPQYDAERGQDPSEETFVEIREPRPAFCPASGPYAIGGQDYVPDSPEFLSQFVAVEGQIRSLNTRSDVIDNAMANYKRMLIVSSKDRNLPQKIKRGKHDNVYVSQGFTKGDAEVFEAGGISAQMAAQMAFDTERADRALAISESYRGNVQPGATATGDAIAQVGNDRRTAKQKDAWYDFLTEVGKLLAFYLDADDEVAFPLGDEAAKQLGLTEPWFMGGKQPGESLEDLEIEIEPSSIMYSSDSSEQALVIQLTTLLTQIAPLMPMAPWIDWGAVIQEIGDAFHRPMLRELVNTDLAEQVGGMQLQMQVQESAAGQGEQASGGTGAPKPPRLAGDQAGTRGVAESKSSSQPASGASGGKTSKRAALPGQKTGAKAFA